jgi:TolA-binding protein
MQRAADEFQYILQEFPNSRYARDAALGLARAYYRLGYYEEAFKVVDYIERRWARFYIDYPLFLNMIGDMAFRLNRLDDALRHYWLYMNLQPFGEEADIILTRLGDIYAMKREKSAARELYTASIERFPGRDGALVAMMRLAEDGMHDAPSIAGMFFVFDGPFSRQPVEVYRTIINKYPDSALVPLAEVKLALWYLWDRQYEQALDILSSFLDRYPHHELTARVRELMLQAFSLVATETMQDQRFGKMRELWERHEGVRIQAESLAPESRIALAVSHRHSNRPNEALEILEPLFYGVKIPEYSEMALSLVLSMYLEYEQWQSILDVARRIDLWELTPETQLQLHYAMALAGENLGNTVLAAPLWQRLYDSGRLPSAQMAYATFFLAREAERNRELERAFFLGREALSRLLEQVERTPNAADVGKIKTQLASLMDVAETAGRLREALAFADQYLQYLGANDPERMAVRYRMARIYKKQGDDDNWQRTLTEIVAQDPGSVFGQLAASELNAASIAREAAQFSITGRI